MGANRVESVTWGPWCVGSSFGDGIVGAVLGVFRRGLHRAQGDHNGKRFVNSDAAHAFALAHGYSRPYFRRASVRETSPPEWRETERKRLERSLRRARARVAGAARVRNSPGI